MKRVFRYLLALAVLAAAIPAAAQPGRGHEGARLEREVLAPGADWRPFELLVRARRELQLTEPQVARLQAIAGRLQERNAPLRRRLLEERERLVTRRREEIQRQLEGKSREERAEILRRLRHEERPRDLSPELRPVVEEMRRNLNAAMREAHGVLTPRQRARARQLMREHLPPREGRGPGARRPHAPGGRP